MSGAYGWYTTRGRARRFAGAGEPAATEPTPRDSAEKANVERCAVGMAGWEPRVGPLVESAALTQVYQRHQGDPVARSLRIYALDPAAPAREGREATIRIPYEALTPGPKGSLLEVTSAKDGEPLDLDSPSITLNAGLAASPADRAFRKQMVYAVAMGVCTEFRVALGRDVGWGFRRSALPDGQRLLRIEVDAPGERNALYYGDRGVVVFGTFSAVDHPHGALNMPGGPVHTALSHDIVTHELTHALVDGLRPHFMMATSADAVALHEALGDLVALFRKFTFEEVVRSALAATRGRLDGESALTAIAKQFGQTTGRAGPLRSALRPDLNHRTATEEPYERSQILVAAVWRAFATVFERKVRRYILTTTAGSGVLPEGELPAYLHELLAREASKVARHFLHIVIRAIDYCPPLDVEFGEFLRAMITADHALVADDPWGYREALVEGFRMLGIVPARVEYLCEDELLWRSPPSVSEPPRGKHCAFAPIDDLAFEKLRFAGDPGRAASAAVLRGQAAALWHYVTTPDHCAEFGLARTAPPGETIDVPRVDSIRTTRRVGPNEEVVFDLVAEVTQRRVARFGSTTMEFTGGATVILDPLGNVRYAIRKDVMSKERLDRQFRYVAGDSGREYWLNAGGVLRPDLGFYRKLDEAVASAPGPVRSGR